MKKTYIVPSIITYYFGPMLLQSASSYQVNNQDDEEIEDGNLILSRRHGQVWDDDEQED